MASIISSSNFGNLGGAVSDLFQGFGATQKASLQAKGLRIQAEGTEISAESTGITAESLRTKARGDLAEAGNYDLAAGLANENAAFTDISTRIQQSQALRLETQTIGAQRAGVAGAGFAAGGTAMNLMRDSAQQGALAQGVIGMQGAINKAGYVEQAQSYQTMAAAGRDTAASEFNIANETDVIAGQQRDIERQQYGLANETEQMGKEQQLGDFFGAVFKGAAAVGSLFLTGNPLPLAETIGLDGLTAIH